MATDNELLLEVRQRLTRIESRICRLGNAAGVDTGTADKGLRILRQTEDTVSIATQAFDVGLSTIAHFLTKEGIEGKVALVYFEHRLVARFYPEGG